MQAIEVPAEEIRAAATQLEAAVEVVRARRHGDQVGQVAAAMPGSQSGPLADRLAQSWRQWVTDWCRSADNQASRMRSSATASITTDQDARTRFQGITIPVAR
ncbi:hypothetical protein [Cellulomonas sp. NPDC089187]|uniref:hypothetical protein n=1 Tax=Cellulomonas sp. NPDC089187 TaxID=3154970 RepID=UPI00342BCF20